MKFYPVSKPSLTWKERQAVTDVIDSEQLTMGPLVHEFEARFAHTVQRRYAAATNNGTTALHLILAALGIGPGDDVLVPNVSFVATANAVAYTGARPVLCDIERETWALNVDVAAHLVTPRTKALIVVHLYGQPSDMRRIQAFAARNRLHVIEDAAEGLGGFIETKAMGSFGIASAFSFYGNKIITTGEGGMAVTNDPQLYERMCLLRGQGQDPQRRYFHTALGFNYRMNELSAGLGVVQLQRLNELLEARHEVMATYHAAFAGFQRINEAAAPWLFTFLVPSGVSRNTVAELLRIEGIDTRPVFVPMHELPMYRSHASLFPVSTAIAAQGLSLPTYPELTRKDVNFIADKAIAAIRQLSHSLQGASA